MQSTKENNKIMGLHEYIAVILPLIKASREMDPNSSHAAKHVRYLYQQAFYGFDEYAIRKASVEAKKLYLSKGFTDKLSQQSIHNQTKFDSNGRKNGDFHFEHVFTGTGFREAVEKLNKEQLTIENIAQIVNEKCICAWILKTENAALNKAGFRSKRPGNPLEAYKKVEIVLED